MENRTIIEKKFPAYYASLKCKCPPDNATEQAIIVYRICSETGIFSHDFKSFFEMKLKCDPECPSSYAISCMMRYTDAEKLKRISSKFSNAIIAKGMTHESMGPSLVCPTRKFPSHVDWWLYCNAEPWLTFSEAHVEE